MSMKEKSKKTSKKDSAKKKENGGLDLDVKMATMKVEAHSAFIRVNKDGEKKVVFEKDSDEVIETRDFNVPHSTVSVGFKYTKNLLNYESAQISVHMSVPCLVEEIDDAYDFASDKVRDKVKEELKSVIDKRKRISNK